MSRSIINLLGQKFGKLTVDKYVGKNKWGASKWLCRCDCGNGKIVLGNSLLTGNTKSCGCKEGNFKHGLSNTKIYKAWEDIIQRCTNPDHKAYKYYGGRIPPITVCDRWNSKKGGSFENFFEDVGEIPEGKEIDRTNNNQGYNPNNFRLITHKENTRNRRTNIPINVSWRNTSFGRVG